MSRFVDSGTLGRLYIPENTHVMF